MSVTFTIILEASPNSAAVDVATVWTGMSHKHVQGVPVISDAATILATTLLGSTFEERTRTVHHVNIGTSKFAVKNQCADMS